MAEKEAQNQGGQTAEQLQAQITELKETNAKLQREYDGVFGDMTKYRNQSKEGKQALDLLMGYNQAILDLQSNPTVGKLSKLLNVDESTLINKIKGEFEPEDRGGIDQDSFLPDDSQKIAKMIESAIAKNTRQLTEKLDAVQSKVAKTEEELIKERNTTARKEFDNFIHNTVSTHFGVYPENIQKRVGQALWLDLNAGLSADKALENVKKDYGDFYGYAIETEAEKSRKKTIGKEGVGVDGGSPIFEEEPDPKTLSEAMEMWNSIPVRLREK